ncbi:MAG: hypothetical protein ACOC9S_06135 [Planctomycetota bacterium]
MKKLLCSTLVLVLMCGCGNGLSLTGGGKPDGTTYTILLHTFESTDHVNQSKLWKRRTVEDAGWDNIYVVHKDEHSALYRGKYRTSEAAQKDLHEAKEYDPGTGIRPYVKAIVMPVPGEQVGPPQWHLSELQGEWTVKVAVFYNIPDEDYFGRKQFAVDYCERLRDNGYEAFYAHDPARSHVYIGDFPPSAVNVDEQGNRQSLNIHSPRMRQILDDFPQLAVNGSGERIRRYNPKTKKAEYVDRKSFPVRVPDEQEQEEGERQEWSQ